MNFPVRMIHQEHGAMHVYDQAQLDRCVSRGWVVETPEPQKIEATLTLPKKRGRPRKAAA